MAGAEAAAPAPAAGSGGKKKLIIMIAAALLVVVIGGAAAFFLLKKKPPAEDGEEGEDGHPVQEAPAKKDTAKKGVPPTFVPLDPFTVNLADKDVDRFAQIGISLEIDDPKIADQLKAYMPAIRGNILMLLSHKVAADLLSKEGKLQLAKEINREAVRPLGIELDVEEADHGSDEAPKKKKKKKPPVVSPVTNVHFSSFIVQ
jgi:flagellar protein FliL